MLALWRFETLVYAAAGTSMYSRADQRISPALLCDYQKSNLVGNFKKALFTRATPLISFLENKNPPYKRMLPRVWSRMLPRTRP